MHMNKVYVGHLYIRCDKLVTLLALFAIVGFLLDILFLFLCILALYGGCDICRVRIVLFVFH